MEGIDWTPDLLAWASSATEFFNRLTIEGLLVNKWARAIGMLVIVWGTIWVIALVYSGYARDSDIGPIGIRPHTNKRLGEDVIVFDQSLFKFQMDGVEATCQFFYQYEDRQGKTRRVQLGKPELLRLHIRSSQIPRDTKTHFGFEGPDDVEFRYVVFPTFDDLGTDRVPATPETVGEYVRQHDLIKKWTEDDEAPIVSIGSTRWELLTDARRSFIVERAAALKKAVNGNAIDKLFLSRLSNDRPNVFGSYYLKMQFSKSPVFVLFKHPNPDLKMTAWLTILTSVFALAMDLWPVERMRRADAPPARAETGAGVAKASPATIRPPASGR